MKIININETISTIEAQGIKVIQIDYSEAKSTRLKGGLDDFIAAVKVFDEKVVFLQDFSFDDEDFFHEPKNPVLGEYDEEPSENGINLTQFLPELSEYKSYLEQTSALIFRVFYKNQAFSYWQNADWYEVFIEKSEKARGIFNEREQKIRTRQELEINAAREAREQRESYLRGLLEALITDDKFILLKTQKAKQEYAIAQHPELSELSQFVLKEEISNLNARIEARRMMQ
jgi:hypothetical protein